MKIICLDRAPCTNRFENNEEFPIALALSAILMNGSRRFHETTRSSDADGDSPRGEAAANYRKLFSFFSSLNSTWLRRFQYDLRTLHWSIRAEIIMNCEWSRYKSIHILFQIPKSIEHNLLIMSVREINDQFESPFIVIQSVNELELTSA